MSDFISFTQLHHQKECEKENEEYDNEEKAQSGDEHVSYETLRGRNAQDTGEKIIGMFIGIVGGEHPQDDPAGEEEAQGLEHPPRPDRDSVPDVALQLEEKIDREQKEEVANKDDQEVGGILGGEAVNERGFNEVVEQELKREKDKKVDDKRHPLLKAFFGIECRHMGMMLLTNLRSDINHSPRSELK